MKGDKFSKTRQSLNSRRFTLSQKVIGAVGGIVIMWLIFSFTFLYRDVEEKPADIKKITKDTTKLGSNRQIENDGTTLQKFVPKSKIEENFTWLQRCQWLAANNARYLANSHQGEGEVTLVSGMFDLGRGNLGNSFTRPFTHYIDRFKNFLDYKFPKIIFIQEEHLPHYQPLIDKNPYPTYVIFKTIDDIKAFKYFDEIQKIRTNKRWSTQEGWLSESPQATMELYNPMVMSKLLWTVEAAHLNPFQTPYFLWIDGGHLCNDPRGLTQTKMTYIIDRLDKMLITYFDYQPEREIHGFEKEGFYKFIGNRDRVVRVGRGGIFGGTPQYLEVAAEIYMEMIGATLSAGYMGTEENIFSMLYYRFPELVNDYENGEGGNCAIFNDAVFGPPIPVDFHAEGFDLRGLHCEKVNGEIKCYNAKDKRTKCPAYVTPKFLAEAKDQWICTHNGMRQENYYCTVDCRDNEVLWFAHSCEGIRVGPCPPYSKYPFELFYDEYDDPWKDDKSKYNLKYTKTEKNKNDNNKKNDNNNDNNNDDNKLTFNAEAIAKEKAILQSYIERSKNAVASKNPSTNSNPFVAVNPKLQYDINFSEEMKRKIVAVDRNWIIETIGGFNLRGLKCEIEVDSKNRKKEVCFLEHRAGRDRCPPYVTSAWLTFAPTQWTCHGVEGFYCTAMCQEGTDKIMWSAHDKHWCDATGDCPKEPEVIPWDEYKLNLWSLPPIPPKPCDAIHMSNFIGKFPKISVGALARGSEIASLSLSLKSWEERGFIQFVDEFLIYINERTDEMNKFLEPFSKPPYNIKVMGNDINYGIIRGINFLVTNSTNDYFLFLEKDFRLVESLPCTLDQLAAGIDLLDSDVAHVIKYRSRFNAGRPNWAEALYRDKEETVFSNQPNLLCNFYHWIDHPEERWPDLFKVCYDDPLMYCVLGRFCNWTNNPFLIHRLWWIKEYMQKYPDKIAHGPYDFNLETWMNWDPDAWDNRNWVIAEGDGMFKHCDANNFGF